MICIYVLLCGDKFLRRYDLTRYDNEAKELHEIVIEGFELLGAFNLSDHLPWLKYFFDPFCIQERCAALVPRVKKLIKQIIDEHQNKSSFKVSNNCGFIHVLLSLDGEEKLDENDMVAVLWVSKKLFYVCMLSFSLQSFQETRFFGCTTFLS